MTHDGPDLAVKPLTITLGEHVFDALAAGPAGGELVLLLHGYMEFADCWARELAALGAAGYRAVAVDQRGYSPGARPAGTASYAVDCLLSDALGFADSQGARRFHLVGHDWGGILAWALAGACPERVKSLSVLSTPHPRALHAAAESDPDQYAMQDYLRLIRQFGGIAEAALLADGGARIRERYQGRVPAAKEERNIRRLIEPGALSAALSWYRAADGALDVPAGRVRVPALYIWGSADLSLGRTAAVSTADWVDGCYQFVELPGASHWLPEEAADRIVPLLLSHLGSHGC